MPKRILQLWISALLMFSSAQLSAAELFFDRQNNSWTKAGNAVSEEAYRGETKNGVPHGTGTGTLPDGTLFVGIFKDGQPDGMGILNLPDGSRFVGPVKNYRISGDGTIKFPNGNMYVGQFKNSQPWGQGTLVQSDGEKYEGNLLMAVLRVKAPINGMTEESTKELFKRVNPKGKVTFFFQTAGVTRARLTMSSSMERGFSSGRMGANTLATL